MPIEAKPLFRPDVLRRDVTAFELPEHVAELRPKLAHWAELMRSKKADSFKEQELLPDFLTDFFCELLGYTRPADGSEVYTLSREKHVQVDGKFADAVLGRFGDSVEQPVVALEGKGPKDPLERPYAGRRMSAVDQAYRYAINLPCDWIIVTSMRETRLYHKGSDQHTYERFETARLSEDDAVLKRFVFLLGAERVTPKTGRCHLYALREASDTIERELTKDFYVRYADMRRAAFDQLRLGNPDVSPSEVLRCTQKLLDRILFCAFCEDRSLLPPETIKKAFEHQDPYNPRPIWENFRGLFRSIDQGNAGLNIPAYNGGLFAADSVLDGLNIPDEVCGYFRDLGAYDYRPANEVAIDQEGETAGLMVDVDILGHIFEQSITDLERLRNELDGQIEQIDTKKTKSRRKTEGAFYTPAFITRYIIQQALGGVLSDRFEALRQRHEQEATGTARGVMADPNVYELDKLNNPQRAALIRFWAGWQEELGNIRILDPACGSGAFLIEAFDQLYTTYQASNDRLDELSGQPTLFDLDRQILQNNLYGVDLNAEAVQICQLSLWIKTAARGKILTSLDETVCEGNSVVSDKNVHVKAFDWDAEFPEVFEQGGFDVVVGNPPYIRQEWLAPYKSHWEQEFESYHGVADIYAYFFERGLEVLREGGQLAFITSGSWVRGSFGAPLREHLSKSAALESIVDFGEFQPFDDAEMIRPSITILSKRKPDGNMRLFKWLTKGRPPENLSDVISSAPTMKTSHLDRETWELEPDAILELRKKVAAGWKTLREYSDGRIYRGILTGLTDVFVIDNEKRNDLIAQDSRSIEVIKPFVQGTHLRPWYIESTQQYLLALKSSANFDWPWSNAGEDAEAIFAETYPAIYDHLNVSRERAVKRQDQGRYWWELRACSYWDAFNEQKIVWPDISKLPRFSMDTEQRYLGNTGYVIPGSDYYLLSILSSWVIWFFISKTAQPLRLRGGRWQYRLIAQFMEKIPIPEASESDREALSDLARRNCSLGMKQYELQTNFQRRLVQSFGENADGGLNMKAQAWWELSLNELGAALKQSYRLTDNPMKNPHTADQWESYLEEKRAEVDKLFYQLADTEAELNDRVFRLFELTTAEIKLLQKEVEH